MSNPSADVRTLGYEAFVYFYPLVIMDVTRRQTINASPREHPLALRPNEFHHVRQYPDAGFRSVVRPNFDTLYSSAWLDLTAGPAILEARDTGGRYFMLPLLDMWTDVFANPGTRTSGTGDQKFAVVGPGNRGGLPDGVPVIHAPTPFVWIIGRTQTNGPADYSAVHAVQDGYSITPLGPPVAQPPEAANAPNELSTEPLRLVNAMDMLDFLSYAADLLRVNPPHPTDFSVLARLNGIGIEAGKPFDRARCNDEQRAQLTAGKEDAMAAMTAAVPTLGRSVNGWSVMTDSIGVYGNSYLQRAVLSLVGLGANAAEDAVYPLLMADADGHPLTGDRNYVIHFDADALPPVEAFWSVTMYDAEGYQVANELDRFALGDRDPLRYNADGSLDLYLQHANPGPDKEPNWLPAPTGPLGVTMRLYAPKREVLSGQWHPPPAHQV